MNLQVSGVEHNQRIAGQYEMVEAIRAYIAHILADYDQYDPNPVPSNRMSYVAEAGSKYIKIIRVYSDNSRSVHSFVAIQDGGKFKAGDILKAAGWKAPALNFARGNVLSGDFKGIRWMGA